MARDDDEQDHIARVNRLKNPNPTLTITPGDVWACTCGNRAELDGFYTTVTDREPSGTPADRVLAREVDPIIGGEWDGHTFTCARCGATYRVPTDGNTATYAATIIGVYRVFVALECVCSYGASGHHTIACLNYQGRAADRALALALAREEADR